MKTKIIKLSELSVDFVVDILKNDGIVIYPTETLYGIGVDATDEDLVKKVFEIKQVDYNRKFISAVSDIDMAKKYFSVDEEAEKLVAAFMPGPFTIIDRNGISFRMPDDEFILEMISKFGKPIVSTSANISGSNANKIEDIINNFDGKVDLIIDDGERQGTASTVFDVRTGNIVRNGPVTKKQITDVLA